MRHVRRGGAVYLLVLLFLGCWGSHFLTMLHQVRDEASTHGEPVRLGLDPDEADEPQPQREEDDRPSPVEGVR